MREIPLGGKIAAGRVALVDDEDYELVGRYSWHVQERPRGNGRRPVGPYARTCQPLGSGLALARVGRKQVQIEMHVLIMGCLLVDHEDHDGLNNQRSNLRPATNSQNVQNGRPSVAHSSQYKGVTWHRKRGKWQVTIKAHGKNAYLGLFASEDDAARAYDTAALAAWGEFAYLNFKDTS